MPHFFSSLLFELIFASMQRTFPTPIVLHGRIFEPLCEIHTHTHTQEDTHTHTHTHTHPCCYTQTPNKNASAPYLVFIPVDAPRVFFLGVRQSRFLVLVLLFPGQLASSLSGWLSVCLSLSHAAILQNLQDVLCRIFIARTFFLSWGVS